MTTIPKNLVSAVRYYIVPRHKCNNTKADSILGEVKGVDFLVVLHAGKWRKPADYIFARTMTIRATVDGLTKTFPPHAWKWITFGPQSEK